MPARLSKRVRRYSLDDQVRRRFEDRVLLADSWSWGRVNGEELRALSARGLLRAYQAFLLTRWRRRMLANRGRWLQHLNKGSEGSLARFQRSHAKERLARLNYEAVGGRGQITKELKKPVYITSKGGFRLLPSSGQVTLEGLE